MRERRPRGRAAPDRLARAQAAVLANLDTVSAYVATLPPVVRLDDGRTLHEIERTPVSVAYRSTDGLTVIASLDPTPHGMLRHVSCSRRDRLPDWDDLKALREAFFPADRDVIQVLPRAGEYINVHPRCLHLFDAPAEWQGGWFV